MCQLKTKTKTKSKQTNAHPQQTTRKEKQIP